MIYGFLFNIINVFKIKELNKKTMEQLSLFLSTLSNDFQTYKTNLIDLLSKNHISKLSYDTKACVRNRKFSVADYLLGALTMMSSSIRESEFTLNSFHMNYNSHLGDEFKMTHKCIHKQLDSEESLTLIKALVVQVMSLVSKRLAKQIKAHLMESLKDLLSLLKVKDIVLINALNWTYVIPAQITLSAKEKAETDLTVPPRDQGSSSMLHTLFVNKALYM